MAVRLVRALVLFAVILLGAVVGAWLCLAASYLMVEPAERTISGAAFTSVSVLLVFGLALLARRVHGTIGLATFAIVVLLSATLAGLAIL